MAVNALNGRDIPSVGTILASTAARPPELTAGGSDPYGARYSICKRPTAMAGIQAAQTRLDAAVIRLEQAYDAYRRKLALQPAVAGAQGGPDIDSLIRSLESTQKENADLTELAETIGERLDSTIDRLQGVIGDMSAKAARAGGGDDG